MKAMSKAGISGCLDLGMNELEDDEVTVVVNAVKTLQQQMINRPSRLDARHLNTLGLSTRFEEGIAPEHWQRLCLMLESLLNETLTTTAESQEARPQSWLYQSE